MDSGAPQKPRYPRFCTNKEAFTLLPAVMQDITAENTKRNAMTECTQTRPPLQGDVTSLFRPL